MRLLILIAPSERGIFATRPDAVNQSAPRRGLNNRSILNIGINLLIYPTIPKRRTKIPEKEREENARINNTNRNREIMESIGRRIQLNEYI